MTRNRPASTVPGACPPADTSDEASRPTCGVIGTRTPVTVGTSDGDACAAPHLGQKRPSTGTSDPQAGQGMWKGTTATTGTTGTALFATERDHRVRAGGLASRKVA